MPADATPEDHQDRALAEKILLAQPEEEPFNDFAWQRVKRTIEADREAAPTVIDGPWWSQKRVAPWQLAASIALVALTVQFAGSLFTTAPVKDDATYQTAGSTEERPTLTVAFVPEATEADIRALLLSVDATFVSGPSALGLYEIAATREGTLEEVQSALEEADDLVESVQRN